MTIKPPPSIKHKPTVIAFPGPGSQKPAEERVSTHQDAVCLGDIIGSGKATSSKVDRYGDVPATIRSTRHASAISSAHRDFSRIKDPVLRGLVKDVLASWDEGAKADPEALVAALLGKKR